MNHRRDLVLLVGAAILLTVLVLIGRSVPRPATPTTYHEPEDGVQPLDPYGLRFIFEGQEQQRVRFLPPSGVWTWTEL